MIIVYKRTKTHTHTDKHTPNIKQTPRLLYSCLLQKATINFCLFSSITVYPLVSESMKRQRCEHLKKKEYMNKWN